MAELAHASPIIEVPYRYRYPAPVVHRERRVVRAAHRCNAHNHRRRVCTRCRGCPISNAQMAAPPLPAARRTPPGPGRLRPRGARVELLWCTSTGPSRASGPRLWTRCAARASSRRARPLQGRGRRRGRAADAKAADQRREKAEAEAEALRAQLADAEARTAGARTPGRRRRSSGGRGAARRAPAATR